MKKNREGDFYQLDIQEKHLDGCYDLVFSSLFVGTRTEGHIRFGQHACDDGELPTRDDYSRRL